MSPLTFGVSLFSAWNNHKFPASYVQYVIELIIAVFYAPQSCRKIYRILQFLAKQMGNCAIWRNAGKSKINRLSSAYYHHFPRTYLYRSPPSIITEILRVSSSGSGCREERSREVRIIEASRSMNGCCHSCWWSLRSGRCPRPGRLRSWWDQISESHKLSNFSAHIIGYQRQCSSLVLGGIHIDNLFIPRSGLEYRIRIERIKLIDKRKRPCFGSENTRIPFKEDGSRSWLEIKSSRHRIIGSAIARRKILISRIYERHVCQNSF